MSGSRRAKGEGSYEPLPSGKWRKVLTVKGVTHKGPAGATKKEASQNLERELRNAANPESGPSFTTWGRSWLKTKKSYSPTTKEVCNWWLDDLEKDPIGAIPILLVSDADLKSWKASKTWANATLRNRCAFLNQILREAGNPNRVEKPKKIKHIRRPLSPTERTSLDTALETEDELMVLGAFLCWRCGLRRSEACGLMHEDWDGDGFWIRRVAVIVKGKIVIRPKAKTSKSHRWVPLPPDLEGLSGKGFVLGEGKTPMNPKLLSDWMYRLKKQTGLESVPYMGLHALRRTCGQTMLEAGADIVTAADVLGHDVQMLGNEYAQSRIDLKTEAIKRAFPPKVIPTIHPTESKSG